MLILGFTKYILQQEEYLNTKIKWKMQSNVILSAFNEEQDRNKIFNYFKSVTNRHFYEIKCWLF